MVDKYLVMDNFLKFCREYKIMGRFHIGDFTFSLCSPSLGWTEISYSELSESFPNYFPKEEPEQLQLL